MKHLDYFDSLSLGNKVSCAMQHQAWLQNNPQSKSKALAKRGWELTFMSFPQPSLTIISACPIRVRVIESQSRVSHNSIHSDSWKIWACSKLTRLHESSRANESESLNSHRLSSLFGPDFNVLFINVETYFALVKSVPSPLYYSCWYSKFHHFFYASSIYIHVQNRFAFEDRRTHPNLVVTCGPVVVLWTRKRKSFYVGMYVGKWQDGLDLMWEDIRRQLFASHQRQQWH